MLILTRKPGEVLLIKPDPETGGDPREWFANGPIRLRINAVYGNQVRIGIEAPRSLQILREELVDVIKGDKVKIDPPDKL